MPLFLNQQVVSADLLFRKVMMFFSAWSGFSLSGQEKIPYNNNIGLAEEYFNFILTYNSGNREDYLLF
jgi:hypothetical protein